MPTSWWRPPPVKKASPVGCLMDESIASDRLDEMRIIIDANLSVLIEEQSRINGEVALRAGEVLLAGGKRLRPILVLLAYELAGGENNDEIMPLALASEFIHTASLVHDDINDEADMRRGKPTLHASHGQAKGIIGGDWLFAQGFALGGRYDKEIVEIMAAYCGKLASAEFSQLDHVLDLSTSPEDYLEIVSGKTAGPFSAGCEAAAIVAGSSKEVSNALSRFGMELGIAFQLVDDLLDIRGDERMGKPRGTDVHEGKMTLPLIHALTLLHGSDRARLAEIISNFTDELFDELISLLKRSESLEYVEILVNTHIERALSELKDLPDCEAKEILEFVSSKVAARHS